MPEENLNEEAVFIKENVQPCQEFICPIIKPDKGMQFIFKESFLGRLPQIFIMVK